MKIVYENIVEFAEAVIKCEDTVKTGDCCFCPMFYLCKGRQGEDISERAVMQCEIAPPVLVIKDHHHMEEIKKALKGGKVAEDEKRNGTAGCDK